MNGLERSASYRSTALTRPTRADWTRSSSETPRLPRKRAASRSASPRWARMMRSRTAGSWLRAVVVEPLLHLLDSLGVTRLHVERGERCAGHCVPPEPSRAIGPVIGCQERLLLESTRWSGRGAIMNQEPVQVGVL